ncbi:MAG: NAD-dependent epimerase/dehydratase family protein [Acetobacteraceae bacterium]|nr:NAD-dependent epimerase/dehydratase family protein [Acetobacteraceae bacterium]
MKITILGGAGFLGRKITAHLVRHGGLAGREVIGLISFDVSPPPPQPDAPFPYRALSGDIAELPEAAIPSDTDVVFFLAAVVSAQAEADYDLGMRVNLFGALKVIEACRRAAAAGRRPPRVVFTSSIATFSGGQDAKLLDDARQVPANSYGAEKAAAELLLQDASRRGFLDAVLLRLPTIIVRPGRPNRAASSFLSAIIREPLLGLQTDLPVDQAFAAWIASPRRAVDWLLHAAAMNTEPMGVDRTVNLPGISATVARLLQALDEVKPGASQLVLHRPDPEIAAIVNSWPAAFEALRARTLGFSAHEPIPDVVRAFVEDDLADTKAERGM